MSDKPSAANEKKPAAKSENNLPVPTNKPAANAAQSAPSSSSSVAVLAVVLSLGAGGGALYLWNQLNTVKQTVVSTTKSDIDNLQKTLEQSIASTTTQATTEMKSAVEQTKGQLEKQISDSTATVASQADAVKTETKQSITSFENTLAETKTQVETILTTTKSDIQKELEKAVTTTNTEIGSAKQEVAAVKTSFDELNQQVADRLQKAEEERASLKVSVETSQQELKDAISRNRTDWAVAEVEHILRLANEQVALEQNPAKAITTLRTADQRLKSLTDPALVKVREALDKDIASLSSVSAPDISGTAQTLAQLAGEIDKLQTIGATNKPVMKPLSEVDKVEGTQEKINTTAEIVANNTLQAMKGFATAAYEGLGGMLVIKKDDKTIAPVIPPSQAFFVKQNLQLKLETARLALLKQDNETFHSAIKTAISWTEQYFSKDVPATQSFIDGLSALGSLNLAPELPDISGSLKALKEAQPNLS